VAARAADVVRYLARRAADRHDRTVSTRPACAFVLGAAIVAGSCLPPAIGGGEQGPVRESRGATSSRALLQAARQPAAIEAEEPVAGRSEERARRLAQTESVLEPTDLPADVRPSPWNPEVDLDRAGILAEGAVGSGEIVLTFDDGPAPETTSEVLRILEAHRVKATFFLTGSRLAGSGVVAEVDRAVARAIVAAGHSVGNHGLDHEALDDRRRRAHRGRRSASRDHGIADPVAVRIHDQIETSARLIAQVTGVEPRWFRPPYGVLGPIAREILARRRDELVMWTIDAQDVRESDPKKIAARLVAQIAFARQGIVLLHDLRPPSVKALALLLDWLASHPRDEARGTGYAVVDLPTYLAHAAARPWPYRDRVALRAARLSDRHLGEKLRQGTPSIVTPRTTAAIAAVQRGGGGRPSLGRTTSSAISSDTERP
jgi:peptidoglycan/xylan/chitin deacetylase (PgdA/CDA1 family)